MKALLYLCAFVTMLLPSISQAQDRGAINRDFQLWLEQTIWPRAQAKRVSRRTFETGIAGISINWKLPDLVIPGAPRAPQQSQAEFRPPARYFDAGAVNSATTIGRDLLRRHAAILSKIERDTGVPARILLAIWGRESSYGRAKIPYDAFEILATKGFLGTRSDYFTNELVAALQILEGGYATRDQMRSSWAGALGQPQFMPSSYLAYAVDGDGDGRADIWGSSADTLASIGFYLKAYGWTANRDWGFEVTLPASASCTLEGPDNGRPIRDWQSMGVRRVSGQEFPDNARRQDGYLLLPAGRHGPAFIVTSNFYVLKDYNESDTYALFVGHVGDKIQFGVGNFVGRWDRLDGMSRATIIRLQHALEARGFDVGGADGFIGNRTRRSVGRWQDQNGIASTCYPDSTTIRALVR